PAPPRRLQQLELPLVAAATCRRLYGTDLGPERPPRRIPSDSLCAGDPQGRADTCKVSAGGTGRGVEGLEGTGRDWGHT
ncbi:PRSS8 protein, partial [Urocolius indicus]|nr:PRSS8 protein [Urocolius indicus]